MISKEETIEIVKKFGRGENDTGSAEVQVALITKRIANLTPHFEKHNLDHHSKRGLMKLIGKRKSLLKYLTRVDHDRYTQVIKKLGLRK